MASGGESKSAPDSVKDLLGVGVGMDMEQEKVVDDGSWWKSTSCVDAVRVGKLGVIAACSVMEGPSWTGSVRWIDPSGEEQDVLACPAGATSLDWIGDSRFIVGLDNGDIVNGVISDDGDVAKLGDALEDHDSVVSSVQCKDDGASFLSSSWDFTVRSWDAARNTVRSTFEGHGARVWDARWKPKDATIASVSQDRTVRVWDARTTIATMGLELVGEPVCVEWLRDRDSVIVVGFTDGRIGYVDTRKSSADAVSYEDHAEGSVTDLCVLPTAPYTLFTTSDDTVVRKIESEKTTEVHRHTDYARSVAILTNEGKSTLFSGGWDKSIRTSAL